MWQRAELKSLAKQELKISYWLSFAVCLVAGLFTGGASGASSASSASKSTSFSDIQHIDPAVTAGILGIVLFSMLIAIMVGAFVCNPVIAGQKSFFIRAPYGDRRFGNLFSAFKSGRYMPTVKTMFVTNLVIMLWSFLFIIPGIVKSYQYRMVAYLISEDPSLSPRQAMDLSRHMTDGEKWKMFVLDLSFIGWSMLGAIAFGIGILFVTPYVEATWAQLYFALKPKVITSTGGSVQPQF